MTSSTQAQHLLADLLNNYEKKNPKSKQSIQDAAKYIPGGTTRSVLAQHPFPLVIQSGQGATLLSVDGDTYLDFVSEYFMGIYGHSHPEILAAIAETAKSGLNYGAPNLGEAELAKLLVNRFPSVEHIRFCNSASEANIFAVAVALHHTQRNKVVVFANGYHGGPMAFGGANLKSPLNINHEYLFGQFNSIEETKKVFEGPDSGDIGVIIIEPMQGAGGAVLARVDFLQYVRKAATELGAVLIFDETVTSRLAYGGLQTYLGVTPDMTTMGKHFGGGFSFGAFGGSKAIMAPFDTHSPSHLHHSGTFNNNVFSMKVGAIGTQMMTEKRINELNALGNDVRGRLGALLQEWDPQGKRAFLTGFGSIIGLGWTAADSSTYQRLLYHFLLSKGIYMGSRGFFALNFAHEKSHTDVLIAAFKDFLSFLTDSSAKL